ncbi:MAG: DUF4339 domain-containing protein [Opitutales bacterium]
MPTKEPTSAPVKEYHLREPESTKSQGPFTAEQMKALAEAGKLEPDTLYWNTQKEEWIAIIDDSPLFSQVFPGRSKLALNREDRLLEKMDTGEGPELTVNQMLATANAETKETRHLARRERNRKLSTQIVPWGIGAGLVISGLALIASQWDLFREVLDTREYKQLASEPFLFIGVVDIILGVLVALGVSALFPVVRLRMALGFGYFGYIYWSIQSYPGAIGVTVASLGVFAMTLSANLFMTILSVMAAVGGMAVFLALNAP